MKNVFEMLDELNESNSSLYKLKTLKTFKDSKELENIFELAYDDVTFIYGISERSIQKLNLPTQEIPSNLDLALNFIRNVLPSISGNEALQKLQDILDQISPQDADLVIKILRRNLQLNISSKTIAKVFPNVIKKPLYLRCDVFNGKTKKKIKFPAILQLKADGTYREVKVADECSARTRSGKDSNLPIIFEELENIEEFKTGYLTGELTLKNEMDRTVGNGLINSLEPPHERIIFSVWDYLTQEEYANLSNKKGAVRPYCERLKYLDDVLSKYKPEHVLVIPTLIVNSLEEATKECAATMARGFEGNIIKNFDGDVRLKMKLKASAEFRCVEFNPGAPGTKREGKVGSIIFSNDEGTIKGKCSGFSDELLDDMTNNPNKYLNKVFEIEFNDIMRGRTNDHYSLSHPRFMEFRDKNETNTLKEVFEIIESARLFK